MNKLEDELWDVYDINEEFLNKTIKRGEQLENGEYHLYVDIWVINKGKLLLTLRAPDKDTAPSKWENTGGSVISNEKPCDGAVRELYEETGIKVREEELIKIGKYTYGNTISYIYLYRCTDEDMWIKLAPRETVDYIWADFNEAKEMIDKNMFVPEIKDKFNLVSRELEQYSRIERNRNEHYRKTSILEDNM